MASCFCDSSISVADSSCSSYSTNACISPNMSLSIQNTVTYVYKIVLSSLKELQVEVSWNKCQMNQGLNITFNSSATPAFKLNTNSRMFRRLKGWRILESNSNFKIEVFWDLSLSKYKTSPEPVDGYYYVIIMVDSEVGLLLGDSAKEAAKRKLEEGTRNAKSLLLVRRDYCSGNTLFSTKAKFSDDGSKHDISVHCNSVEEWLTEPFFSVSIDKKEVVRVERLKWNFRGNHSLFIDDLMIDLLWDVNEWLINPHFGSGIFMFRRRGTIAFDRRMWVEFEEEEDMVSLNEQKDMEGDFSLLIYACKNL